MDSAPTAWAAEDAGEEWELRHDDDGFTYKILKRQRLSDPAAIAADSQRHSTDPKAQEKHRRQRKRNTLLKLKTQYQKEIDQWELLSNNLRTTQERTSQELESQKQQKEPDSTTAPFPESTSSAVKETGNPCGSLIDELLRQVIWVLINFSWANYCKFFTKGRIFGQSLVFEVCFYPFLLSKLQAEAQEAIIHDISNVCDVAEAMCNAQQEQIVQSFVNLPVWSSPRELMASLCDE